MRGVAGSGKSYLAHKLCREYPEFQAIVLGSDHYFENANGEYVFKARELGKAHEWNRERVENCMCMSFAAIFVDNTNTTANECHLYLKLADRYGYEVCFKEPDWSPDLRTEDGKWNYDFLRGRSSHNVPDNSIKKMINRYLYQFKNETDEQFKNRIYQICE